jgi:nucleotide-binding universal stress UspA family protein
MRTIVVGIDLSEESELALSHAIDLAQREDATVVLAMVDCVPEMPPDLDTSTRELANTYVAELEARLAADRAALGALRERWSGRGPVLSQVIGDGFADEVLPGIASERHADLVVVGSRGRTGMRRVLLGSVAERVVRRAEQSVLVVRGGEVQGGYRRVVFGIDGSTHAEMAMARALPLLAHDVHVDLVFCTEIKSELRGMLRDAGERLNAQVRALGRPAPELHTHLIFCQPTQGLVTMAAERQADLVVVGSHGRRGIRRFVLGSVAETTVRHAHCSVFVGR